MARTRGKTEKAGQEPGLNIPRINRALADPTRFRILESIASRPETACLRLREQFTVTPATLSHHLKELADAGLIESRRDGKCVHLRLQRKVWKTYLAGLAKL